MHSVRLNASHETAKLRCYIYIYLMGLCVSSDILSFCKYRYFGCRKNDEGKSLLKNTAGAIYSVILRLWHISV